MARIFSDGSGGAGSEHASEQVLSISESGTVQLPDGIDATALDLSRDGQDLVMTTPDGQVFVVENYFLAADAPVIVSESGALLSPALVQSFLTSAGDVQLAANEQASDASPVGHVTEVSGEATVTHADGTKEKITSGTEIYEGDIVETDAEGAVNITFADESTFAVSENARLAIDDFSFNPSDQSGTTGLSILRGVFMFTSGLIGRENPDAVQLETPVGSIGIRGTIIGGHIDEGGHSQISVIEGAIVVRNGAGEQILSGQFETVQLTSFNVPMTNIGQLDSGQMTQSYGAVRNVSPTLFTSIDDVGRDAGQPQNQQQGQPQNQQQGQPAGEGEQQQPQGQQGQAPQNDGNGEQQQAQGDQPQQQPQQQPPATDRPVFQELNTGSNLEGQLQGPAPAPQTAAPPPPPPPPPSTNTAPPPPPPPPSTTEDTGDRRPPATATFLNGGNIAEELAAGTVVAKIGMNQALPFPVTYSLVNNPGNHFVINPSTGDVTLATKAGDYDTGLRGYDVTVRITRTDTGQFSDTPLHFNLTPVDEAPKFNTPTFVTPEDQAVILNPTQIGATDPEGDNSTITYTVVGANKGTIQHDVSGTWTTITNGGTFTQAELASGKIRYVPNGDEPNSGASTLVLHATDANGKTSPDIVIPITVTPENDAPVQVNNAGGTIFEGTPYVITSAMLSHTDSDNPPSQVVYTLTGTTNGTAEHFNGSVWNALANGNTFTQADVNNGKIRFVQDGTETSSADLQYTVSDGIASPQAGTLGFTVTGVNDLPVQIDNNGATVLEGSSVLLDNTVLEYSDAEQSNAQLTYTVTGATNGTVERYNGSSWVSASTFTQADLDAQNVRFVHDDSETTAASFDYDLSDGVMASPIQGTFNLTVTPVNDQISSVEFDSLSANFLEREATGASEVPLTTLNIADGENPASNPDYTNFLVERWDGSNYVTDTRFNVIDNGGTWQVVARDGIAFDHETEPTIALRVTVTDGSNTDVSTTQNLTITINDANELASNLFINEGHLYESGTYDALIQGNVAGARIARLSTDDPDVGNTSFLPDSSHYRIASVSGTTTLTANDFEIVNITTDTGEVDQILKLKDSVTYDFNSAGDSITVTVELDADMDAGFSGTNDITKTYTFLGRNDTMVLESVNGQTGFEIINDARFNGARFGAGMAVGDLDGDGKTDLVIGAPLAQNGDTEHSGGYFAFYNNSGLYANANDGEVTLNSLVTGSSAEGFFYELATASDDNNHHYASDVAFLKHFNSTPGTEIAITNPGDGTVEIRDASNNMIATFNNIPISGVTGDALAKAINVTSIGDINGDGYSDLAIGAIDSSGLGQLSIFKGAMTVANASFASGTVLSPYAAGEYFADQIAGLGDVNGDGYDDFVAGSSFIDTNSTSAGDNQGAFRLYFGSQTFSAPANVQVYSLTDNEQFSANLSAAGDFNGDGLADILVQTANSDSGRGSVSLIFGNENFSSLGNTNIANLNGTANFDGTSFHWSLSDSTIKVGGALSNAGDFNGDGYGDIAIDVSRNLGSEGYEHTIYVVYGSATPLSSYNLDALTTDPSKAFKIRLLEPTDADITLASAGDLNGDGFDDLLIGDPGQKESNGAVEDGNVAVVYGANYDGVAQTFSTGATATATGQSFVGGSGNDSLDSNSQTSISFRGGEGNDTMTIKDASSLHHYDGGQGKDTLSLFFSSEESSTPAADFIDLRGVRADMTNVEVISFASGSKQDTLKLDIRDVISLASDSDLVMSESGSAKHVLMVLGANTTGGNENSLALYDGANVISNISAGISTNLRFVNDADGVAGQDTRVVDSQTFYVYTHQGSGTELLVDARLSGAQTLAG